MCDGGHLTLHALLWAKRNFRTRLNLNFRFASNMGTGAAIAPITFQTRIKVSGGGLR